MNRIDKVVVFRSLKEHHLRQILDIELASVQDRITESAGTKFIFECTDRCERVFAQRRNRPQIRCSSPEAFDRTFSRLSALEPRRYAAGRDRRFCDRSILIPRRTRLRSAKQSGKMIVNESTDDSRDSKPLTKSDAVGAPLPQAQAATGMSKSKGENTDV